MAEKSNPDSKERPASKPLIPEAANDGFPVEKDVSTPPPGSDPVAGQHKKEDKEE